MPKPVASTPSGQAELATHVVRKYFLSVVVLLTVPWLIAGAIYLRHVGARAPEPPPLVSEFPLERRAGPWGPLTATPIVVSPPLEYVAADWARPEHADSWFFPGVSPDEVRNALGSFGLPADSVARLMANARQEPAIRGTIIVPDLQIVRTMNVEVRARLYSALAKHPLNSDQAHSFRFVGSDPDSWLRGSLISPETQALVRPLIYRAGEFMHFADAALVHREIVDSRERQRLAKTLLRQSTLLVTLTVSSSAEVAALADYWGMGGRRIDIRPLLESIAATGRPLDIVHLLPSFGRNHLYRYPRPMTANYDKPLLANCLWSSLNFFAERPDDRFLDVATALETLKTGYHVVESDYRLGDIVAFVDQEGDLFHAAVYLADGLLFTKNGMSPVAPWTIMPAEQVIGYYGRNPKGQRLIYHRRNDF